MTRYQPGNLADVPLEVTESDVWTGPCLCILQLKGCGPVPCGRQQTRDSPFCYKCETRHPELDDEPAITVGVWGR